MAVKIRMRLTHNGHPVGEVDPNKLFNSRFIKAAIDHEASFQFENMLKDSRQAFDDVIEPFQEGGEHFRPFSESYPRKQTHLSEAYEAAFNESKVDRESGILSMKLVDLTTLDRLLPIRGGSGGWWRLYEFGAPSLRGSSKYTFIEKPGWGKHGEGFMVRTSKKTSFKPPVKPFHILHRLRNRLESNVEHMRREFMRQLPYYILK